MVDNIGIGVSLIGRNMEVFEMNRQMRQWFPNIDVSTHLTCHKVFNDPPSDTNCDWRPTCKTLQDGTLHESITRAPVSGNIRNCLIVSSPIVEMVEDITDRHQLEAELRKAWKMEAIGNLAAGIAMIITIWIPCRYEECPVMAIGFLFAEFH